MFVAQDNGQSFKVTLRKRWALCLFVLLCVFRARCGYTLSLYMLCTCHFMCLLRNRSWGRPSKSFAQERPPTQPCRSQGETRMKKWVRFSVLCDSCRSVPFHASIPALYIHPNRSWWSTNLWQFCLKVFYDFYLFYLSLEHCHVDSRYDLLDRLVSCRRIIYAWLHLLPDSPVSGC